MLKVSNRNTRKRSEICSKLTIKTPEQRHWCRSGDSIVDFEHISHFLCLSLFFLIYFSLVRNSHQELLRKTSVQNLWWKTKLGAHQCDYFHCSNMRSDFWAMKIRTDLLHSDIMPIQVLTTPKRYDGRCKGNSCCLYFNNKNGKKGERNENFEKSGLGELFQEKRRQRPYKYLHFFTISTSPSSSWILYICWS